VVIFNKYVVKIPIDYRGYLQGKNEKQIWKKYNKTNLLAPLKWELYGVVCQTRCKGISDFDYEKVIEIKQLIPQFDIDNCDLYNKDNWGIYQNNQVLLDYGIDEGISKMY
jgi:hypothetical protein